MGLTWSPAYSMEGDRAGLDQMIAAFQHTDTGGIMRNPGIGCVLLALGLVFLSLCSTGQAIDCYTCDRWSADQCTISGTCAATDNACMRVTLTDGTSKYSCRVYDKCTSPLVSEENGGIKNFEIKCCQKNLCNSSGLVASPSAVLLLSLAAAALLLLSS